ncbi:MAG: hypothetical protein JRF15_16145 [Deltaproteobacteria bacterium]|jgi:hypothetical protein|nr:hypothetical protein [Deltaproteobacteria bacterium]
MMFEIRRPSIRRRGVSIAIPLTASALAFAAFWNASPSSAQTPGPSTAPVDIYHSTNDDGVHPDPSLPPGCVAGSGSPGASNVLVLEPVAQGRGAALVADLTALGHTATLQTTLPADLSVYASIWYVAAFEAITTANQDRLRSFIQSGGGVHLTGERPCCETLNASVQALVNSVVVGGGITVGDQGDPTGPYPINATAVGDVATNPNSLTTWIPNAPGGMLVPDPENVFATSGIPGVAVGAVWDSNELVGGNGRLSVLMDWDWFQDANPSDRLPVIENLQAFLGAGASGGGNVCVLNGGANERLNVWIDGGNTASGQGETVCKFGPNGGSGDNLCGADMLIEMTGGSITGIEPTVDTLVCSPSCANCEANETGICPLPADTTSIRMNFRRGAAYAPPNAPPVGPRRVATLIVESSGNSAQNPSRVFASGVAAAGANLQVRRIANAADVCTGSGQPFACCTGAGTGDGEWPCGPRVIATGDVPEPAQILQLLGGLLGMSYLYRRRRRA